MCGIFGYIGDKNATVICLDGLKKLEYRGYDSSGIAGIKGGKIVLCKELGKISVLEKAVQNQEFKLNSAISHTRWATHGKPSKENAHPHLDEHKTIAVVHNGVIENYAPIRDELKKGGIAFSSETDTEVIAQLIASLYQRDLFKAAVEAFKKLDGSFAVVVIHKDHPDTMIAVAQQSPLVVAYSANTKETFVASDTNALVGQELDLYFLADGEIATLQKEMPPKFYNKQGVSIVKNPIHQTLKESLISKGKYDHYMLKEICEQATTIRDAMLGRYDEANRTAIFEEIPFASELKDIENIEIIACGTSYHAAFIAAYLFESVAKVSAHAEIASEFRYRSPVVKPKSLIIALSQSGETADTIAAVRNVKGKSARVIGLCNVRGSTLTREVDATIFLNSGPEVAVASTKTFTSQVVILYLLTLMMARMRGMNKEEGRLFSKWLYELPDQVAEILNRAPEIQKLAKKYAHFEDFFFLGRGVLYPTALEAALKLKEIAYINAQGYPSGEMKHGPIALLCKEVPAVVFCANEELQQKIMSNLMESKARGAPIIVFGWKEFEKEIVPNASDIFWIPKTSDELASILLSVVGQLFAYYIALERGTDIDQPRNLAKSVTVE